MISCAMSFPFAKGLVDETLLAAVRDSLSGLPQHESVAVAVSGGADSAMLAVHASLAAREAGRAVRLFHVHHGLQATADGWAEHVGALAQRLDVPLDVVRVSVDTQAGLGIEAAARNARYEALAGLAARHGVQAILLAHHHYDQAETLLLRLLRGTGPRGMAGMARAMTRDGICYLRPWLGIRRPVILRQAQRWFEATGWQVVADPSNLDTRYGRGAVRSLLAPVLDARWPGWRDSLARHGRQAAEANVILDEVAEADFAGLDPDAAGLSFSLAAWRELAPAHQVLVLRHWFSRHGVAMPTETRLAELVRQLRQLHALGHDRQMLFAHDTVQVRCRRGRVMLEPRIRMTR